MTRRAGHSATTAEGPARPVVAIVDSVDIFRVGLLRLFHEAGYATATPSADLESWIDGHEPDLVTVVVRSREQYPAIAKLKERAPRVPVLALINEAPPDAYWELIRAGASAVLPVSSECQCVISSAAAAICGNVVLPASVARILASTPDSTSSVSQRDLDWIRELAHGRTISSLAKQSGYSERNLHRLLSDIYQRLGVRTRSEAIAAASRRGLLSAVDY